MYCLYKLTFPNNKCYIGITSQALKDRWLCGHGYKAKKGKSSVMDDAIKLFGWANVKKEVLIDYSMDKEEAAKKEKEYIALYKSNDPDYGYNIQEGGFYPPLAESTKEKISKSHMGKNYGRVGENASNYGKHHSEETKKRISESTKGEQNHMWGKHHTEETKNRIRETHKGICKPIRQYDLEGNFIAEFPSIHVASYETGINRQCISFAIRGKYKTAGKFIWKDTIRV